MTFKFLSNFSKYLDRYTISFSETTSGIALTYMIYSGMSLCSSSLLINRVMNTNNAPFSVFVSNFNISVTDAC